MRKNWQSYSDEKLIMHVQNGNAFAFKELFRRYYQELCGFACFLVKDKPEAEEIVQDLFAQLWEKRADLTIHSSVKGYLFISCKNRSLNFLHRCSNYQHQELENIDTSVEAALSQNPEHILNFEYLHKDFHTAVNQLPPQSRKVFKLRYFKNTRQKEVAQLLKISEHTVEKHMGYALKALRQKLAVHRIK